MTATRELLLSPIEHSVKDRLKELQDHSDQANLVLEAKKAGRSVDSLQYPEGTEYFLNLSILYGVMSTDDLDAYIASIGGQIAELKKNCQTNKQATQHNYT